MHRALLCDPYRLADPCLAYSPDRAQVLAWSYGAIPPKRADCDCHYVAHSHGHGAAGGLAPVEWTLWAVFPHGPVELQARGENFFWCQCRLFSYGV